MVTWSLMRVGSFQRISRQRRDFPRDADDAVPIGPVRRDFQIVNHIATAPSEIFGEGLADFGVFAQNQEAIDLVGQTEFLRRTHHPVRFHAANLPNFNRERLFFAGFQWQRCTRKNERNFVTGLEILRTANDLAFALAIVHAAKRKFVRIGMSIAGDDLSDDDPFKFPADFVDAFDFEPEHGQPLRELLRRPIKIHVLFQPIKGDFHFGKKYEVLRNTIVGPFLVSFPLTPALSLGEREMPDHLFGWPQIGGAIQCWVFGNLSFHFARKRY